MRLRMSGLFLYKSVNLPKFSIYYQTVIIIVDVVVCSNVHFCKVRWNSLLICFCLFFWIKSFTFYIHVTYAVIDIVCCFKQNCIHSAIVIISSTNKYRKHKSSMLIWVLPIDKMIITQVLSVGCGGTPVRASAGTGWFPGLLGRGGGGCQDECWDWVRYVYWGGGGVRVLRRGLGPS